MNDTQLRRFTLGQTSWIDGLAAAIIAMLVLVLAVQAFGGSNADEMLVTSPDEGFFLVAENHGDAALVQVGDTVLAETVVGYVQATQKEPIFAGAAGTISSIEVEDLAPVSAGQVVMRISN